MGRGTLGEVWDRLGDAWGGPGLVGGTYRKSGMDWDTLGEIGMGRESLSVFLDGLEDPREVVTNGGFTERPGTGRGTLRQVRDGSRDSRVGPGRVEVPSCRSGMGRGTLRVVRDVLGDPPEGLERVGGPSGRFEMGWGTSGRYGMGRGTFGKVRNVSGDTRGVGDELRDTGGDPGWVGGPARRSGTGWGTHGEVRDWSGDPGEV